MRIIFTAHDKMDYYTMLGIFILLLGICALIASMVLFLINNGAYKNIGYCLLINSGIYFILCLICFIISYSQAPKKNPCVSIPPIELPVIETSEIYNESPRILKKREIDVSDNRKPILSVIEPERIVERDIDTSRVLTMRQNRPIKKVVEIEEDDRDTGRVLTMRQNRPTKIEEGDRDTGRVLTMTQSRPIKKVVEIEEDLS